VLRKREICWEKLEVEMAWVWTPEFDDETWPAEFDDEASVPLLGHEYLSEQLLPENSGTPVYRSKSDVRKFRSLNCIPTEAGIIVSRLWQDIILKCVPANRVQFYPVKLVARGEETMEFSWVIPFDKVACVDLKRTQITNCVDQPGLFAIISAENVCHTPNCMGDKHLARDAHWMSHVLVSDALRDALVATGQDVFKRPEELTA
jgi:hypothetical protein